MTTKPTQPAAHDPSRPSSFSSRKADREAHEAVHGPPAKPLPRSLRVGDNDSGTEIRRVRA